jgi:hypothetical protein
MMKKNQILSSIKNLNTPSYSVIGPKEVFLYTKILILITIPFVSNHALVTDTKLFIYFPYFKITITDTLISLFDLIEILNIK